MNIASDASSWNSGKAAVKISLLVAILLLAPTKATPQTIRFNSGDPLRFGIGYNTLTGQYAGNCTVDVQQTDIHNAGTDGQSPGQSTRWELSSVQDLQTLSEKLDFSASASASFIAGSLSISAQYVQSKSFNSFHQFLYLDATVANLTQVWTKPALTEPMAQLRQKNPLDFLDRCGDTFVQTITNGGELTAILDLSTTAQEDSSSLAVAISGSYATAEGHAEMKQQLQRTLLNRQAKVTVIRTGGAGALPSYSADDLIAISQTFPDNVQQHPYPMIAQLASYSLISPAPSMTSSQESYIRPLFRAYRRGMQYLGDLVYVRSHTAEFRTLELPNASNEPATQSNLAPSTRKAPNSADAKAWQDFEAGLASDRGSALDIVSKSVKQRIVSTNFKFVEIDKDALDAAITNYQAFEDQLGDLARACLNNPKTACAGAVPAEPERIPHLVRVFSQQRDWNTSAGPVSIVLDQSWACQVEYIVGTWKIGDAPNAPVAPCDTHLPHTVVNGYILTGGFDSYYPDNHGVCTYQLLCFRR